MPAKKPPPPDARSQAEDFIETARKLGADESREAFEQVFSKIARVKPSAPPAHPSEKPTSS
jgi:hypothetical protein